MSRIEQNENKARKKKERPLRIREEMKELNKGQISNRDEKFPTPGFDYA